MDLQGHRERKKQKKNDLNSNLKSDLQWTCTSSVQRMKQKKNSKKTRCSGPTGTHSRKSRRKKKEEKYKLHAPHLQEVDARNQWKKTK
jgi:hypothetical protein